MNQQKFPFHKLIVYKKANNINNKTTTNKRASCHIPTYPNVQVPLAYKHVFCLFTVLLSAELRLQY